MGHRAALILILGAATVAAADEAPPSLSAPDHVVGDGRAVAPVTMTADLPPLAPKPLPVPEVATVRCTGASSLAATDSQPPAVLAPVVTKPAKLACVARLRDVESKFELAVRPPGPGLYATTAATDVRSTTTEVTLEPFVWDGTQSAPPGALRAVASHGRIEQRDGKLVLALAGNAPRMIAIALADGDRLGAAFVPVTGVTTIPIESEAGASVQCWIAGRWFGPARTKGRLARVPIEVPPGITHGIARSTGRAGYVTDAVTDLKIPAQPRIAAVTTTDAVRAGERTTLAVAVAGADGRPGASKLAVRAAAKRGKLGAVESLGGGLWKVSYTAPSTAGADRVTIRIDGDARAGKAEVDLEVAAGNVSRIELDVPPGPYEPGSEITGKVRVFDRSNNPIPDATPVATLGDAQLTVTRGELRGRVPTRLPASGELELVVSAGGVEQRASVRAGGAAATASVDATVDGRRAIAELAVRDRHGNLVPEGAFDVEVTGGTLRGLSRGPRAFRADVVAASDATSARLVVRAKGQVLADEQVRFDPPAHAYVVGAWASGGWVDNLGVLASPRGGAGLAVRRGIGGVELGLSIGAELMTFSDTTQVMIDGMMRDAERSLGGIGLVTALRARMRLSRLFGVAVSAGVVATRVRVKLDTGVQSADDYAEGVLGVRGQLHGDFRLGPGRLFAGAAYGRAALSDGAVVGQIEGLAVVGGYEWWFADFGW